MSTFSFDLDRFAGDSKNTLLNPGRYFSSLELTGGFQEAFTKVIAYGTLSGMIYLICWIFRIRSFGAGYTGDAVGFLAFLKIIIVTAAGSGIGSVILMFISVLCRGNAGFEPCYRVTSSLMAALPVYSVLSISANFGFYTGLVITFIFSLYFLWLLYNALIKSLKCRRRSMRSVIISGLFLIFIVTFLSLRSNMKKDDQEKLPKKAVKELKRK